jgi:DNA-binding transcriptional ArsR family regulator
VLARLLGATRGALLESLAEPASTGTLARRHGLAPSTVSEHLAALHDARLVARRRHRHTVMYRQAPLGAQLAAPGGLGRRSGAALDDKQRLGTDADGAVEVVQD